MNGQPCVVILPGVNCLCASRPKEMSAAEGKRGWPRSHPLFFFLNSRSRSHGHSHGHARSRADGGACICTCTHTCTRICIHICAPTGSSNGSTGIYDNTFYLIPLFIRITPVYAGLSDLVPAILKMAGRCRQKRAAPAGLPYKEGIYETSKEGFCGLPLSDVQAGSYLMMIE